MESSISCSAPSSPEESSVVQVMDSNEPLVTSSSSVPSSAIDSNEPLLVSRVQVLDSSEPFVPVLPPEPVPGCSGAVSHAVSLTSSESSDEEQPTGSTHRRKNYYAEEVRSQWNHRRLFQELDTTAQCLQFAEDRNLILREKVCGRHRRPMAIKADVGQIGAFVCRKAPCRTKTISRAQGTFFENVRLPINVVFHVLYLFSVGADYLTVQRETAQPNKNSILSSKTIADWYSYCREAVVVYELEHQDVEGKIGGPGKIVQIDESKFGKRKYNRGRQIEGHWVLGMIEDGSDDLRLEVCPDNERSSEILVPLIQKHVQAGTTIHTDFWRAYDCLPEHGFIHKKVNHSDRENRFVAPDGTHTQRIESHWRNIKRMFNKDQYKTNFADWLVEYRWRRKITIGHKDPFEELLSVIQYVYKVE